MPRWFKVVCGAWLSLLVAVSLAYYTGAGGIRAGGVRMEFDRDRPQQLYRIDDERAFLVEPNFISVVQYARSNLLLYVCGCYTVTGAIANGVDLHHGPWVYTSHPGGPRFGADAVNLDTGETIVVPVDRDAPTARQPLLARGLDFAPSDELTPQQIAAAHDTLWLRRESCIDWLGAFYAAGLLLVALAPVAFWRGRRRRRER